MTGFLNTIILLGAIQGFIISILLYRRKTNKQADRLLAALIFLMALASTNLYCFNTGWFEINPVVRIISDMIPMIIVMPMGPLIFFYIKSSLDPSFKLARRHTIQFYAAVIDIIPELTAIIFVAGLLLNLIKNNPEPWGIFIDDYNKYVDIPRWLSVTVYVWLSYRAIQSAKTTVAMQEKKTSIKWLKQFVLIFLAFQAIWLIYLVPYIMPAYSNKLLDAVGWYPIYIPLAVMIYWLGLKGYLVSWSFSAGGKKKRNNSIDLPHLVVDQTKSQLQKAMEGDKLYLNPDLSLDIAAKHTGIPSKTISTVLNQHMNKSFNEWVNEYRVQEFKLKIVQGKVEQLTLSAIASECGFNSQATFQRIFKQTVGMTPSEYLKTTV